MNKSFFLTIVLFIIPVSLMAQTNQKPCNCCTPEYRQFDFWIGDWEVYDPDGNLVGTNVIELQQDSCMLKENWIGTSGGTGTSFNYYDKKTKKWNQLWLNNSGGNLKLSGVYSNNNMVLESDEMYSEKHKTYYKDRITWTNNTDGTVKQHWQRTQDKGKTWTTVFIGLYKQKANHSKQQ